MYKEETYTYIIRSERRKNVQLMKGGLYHITNVSIRYDSDLGSLIGFCGIPYTPG